jgi:hypothetical protein
MFCNFANKLIANESLISKTKKLFSVPSCQKTSPMPMS